MAPQDANRETRGRSASVSFERERGVTEIQVTRGLAHVTVQIPREHLGGERLALLQALAAASISVFLIKLHPGAVSFAVRADAIEPCETLLRGRDDDYALLRDLGLIAVVAGAMRDLSGVIARIYGALVDVGVRVQQTGDAYNAVILLVAGEETDRAADALRRAFSLGAPEETEAGPREGVGLKAL